MYHATPWGKHVNEGVPEWPPSPWRLVRAMIAAWKNAAPDISDEAASWSILQKLINDLPHYSLPDASVSHSRHYVPTAKKSTLIMDTCVVIGDKPVVVTWNNVDLNGEETRMFGKILKNLHYLGRAESWCTAGISAAIHSHNCTPLDHQTLAADADRVQVLVPRSDVKFVDISRSAASDQNILNSISVTTRELQDKNYVDPPGGRFVYYSRPQNCFEQKTTQDTRTSHLNNITLVRYAVVGTVRPSIKDTLRIGDLARAACMSRYGKKKNSYTSYIFSGKDGRGKPLTSHRHAFYLPTCETQNTEIDSLTVIASGGLDKDELDVLFDLKKLYRYNMMDVRLVFQGCGTRENFPKIPILGMSRRWVSATPMVLSRHIKYRGRGSDKSVVDGPEDQICSELKNRYPDYKLKTITIHDKNMHGSGIKPHDFFRWRQHGSVGNDRPYNVQLEFEEPVRGPISLGYSSHYGLGMFVPLGESC